MSPDPHCPPTDQLEPSFWIIMNSPRDIGFVHKAQNLFFSEEFIRANGFWIVLVLSGFFGLLIGGAYSTWHVMVETSQVVAGIVKYPKDNPFYIYHVKAWTLLHQVGAAALLMGISEKTLSIMVSGLIGMMYFQALALFVFTLSGKLLVSILIPFFMQYTQAADFGISYPIKLVGFFHTYGAFGQSLLFLIIALFCAKKFRAGGVLLGMAPAFHLTLGVFLCLVLLIVFLWDFRRLRDSLFLSLKFFAVGFSITVTSVVLQAVFINDGPRLSSEVAQKYMDIVIKYWDFHRVPVNFFSINLYLGFLSIALCASLLIFFRKTIPDRFVFPLRVFIVTGSLGTIACLMTHLPPETLDWRVTGAMPTRLFNMNILGLIPLLVGMLSYYKEDFVIQSNMLLLILVLAVVLGLHPLYWGRIFIVVTTVAAIVLMVKLTVINDLFSFKPDLPVTFVLIVMIFVGGSVGVEALSARKIYHDNFKSWDNDPLFAKIHADDGVLLVGPHILGLIQLYAGRPVLLGPLTSMTQAPEAGPAYEKILKDVYGVDMFNPSAEALAAREIPIAEVKELWESRTPEEWQWVREKYRVMNIFTYADWKLQLPVAHPAELRSTLPGDGKKVDNYVLYHIP